MRSPTVMQSQRTNPHMKDCLDWALDIIQEKEHVFVYYHWNISIYSLAHYSYILYKLQMHNIDHIGCYYIQFCMLISLILTFRVSIIW